MADVAGQVVDALGRGVAVVPMLAGYCVLTGERRVPEGFSGPYRLVSADALAVEAAGIEPPLRGRVLNAMAGPLVGCFGAGRPGVALASEPLTSEIVRRAAGEIWFGVPAAGAEPGELADELGKRAAIVVTGGARGPGPTIADFSTHPVVVDRRGKLAILHLEEKLGDLVRVGPGVSFAVLVVCTGNSCRSPMAQRMLAKLLEGTPSLVTSAGTDAPVGAEATEQAIEALREIGLDLTGHRAQQLVPGMVEAADLVLVMENYHRERVTEMVPDAAERTRLLLTFAGIDEPVADPLGMSVACYRLTRETMRPALERVAAEVRQRMS